MSRADTLRAAATIIRKYAEQATPGPWVEEFSGETGPCVIPADAQSTREFVAKTQLLAAVFDAKHIALWHPLVALLAADLLDAIAQDADDNGEFDGADHAVVFPPSAIALRLAELIVGGAA